MAYKLYINNKLFNGIGNNNYNKGSITINGTTYQFDNSSGSTLQPITYSFIVDSSTTILPTSGKIIFASSSGGSKSQLPQSYTVDGKTFEYYWQSNSATRSCSISLTNDEWTNYDVTVYVYYYTTSNRTLTIGNTRISITTSDLKNRVSVASGTITDNENTITQSGNMGWCGVDVVLTPKS